MGKVSGFCEVWIAVLSLDVNTCSRFKTSLTLSSLVASSSHLAVLPVIVHLPPPQIPTA